MKLARLGVFVGAVKEILRRLARIERGVNEVKSELLSHHDDECRGSLGGFVAAVYGRRTKMPINVPVPKLLDTEQIQLSVMPRKADGHVDVDAQVSWVSSDSAQGEAKPGRIVNGVINTDPFDFTDTQNGDEVVTCPGAFNCVATTPNSTGRFVVTASAPGYEAAEFGPITYEPGQPRSLNASVGSPVSDL